MSPLYHPDIIIFLSKNQHSHVIPCSPRWSVRAPPVACCVATSRAIAGQMWTRLCAAGMRPVGSCGILWDPVGTGRCRGNFSPTKSLGLLGRSAGNHGYFPLKHWFGKIYGWNRRFLPMTSESKPVNPGYLPWTPIHWYLGWFMEIPTVRVITGGY